MGEISQPRPTITVESVTEADLREAMLGSGNQGNPSYQEQFGMTSAPLGTTGAPPQPSIAQLEIEAQQALARATDPAGYANQMFGQSHASPDLATMQAELERFKKLYGDSENEKGQARKREAELMEAFTGLMTQYESLQASPQAPQSWAVPQSPFAPQYAPQVPQFSDPFEGVPEGDFVDGKTVRTVVEKAVGQTTAYMAGQVQQALMRANQLEQQLAAQARTGAGITKLDEFRITGKNPWINKLPYGERLSAIQALKVAEAPAQAPTNGTQAPQAPSEVQHRIINRLTHIEGGNPMVPDQTEAALEAAKQRDYAMAMSFSAETGERAKALRMFGAKYGIPLGQGGSDLSR